MVTLLVTPSCLSSRKAKEWLGDYGINFKERNIYSDRLSINEVKRLIQMTENGVDEILSKRSKAFKEIKEEYETLPLKYLIRVISKNPEILRSPILMDDKRLLVGYSEDQIRCFMPRKARTHFLENAKFILSL